MSQWWGPSVEQRRGNLGVAEDDVLTPPQQLGSFCRGTRRRGHPDVAAVRQCPLVALSGPLWPQWLASIHSAQFLEISPANLTCSWLRSIVERMAPGRSGERSCPHHIDATDAHSGASLNVRYLWSGAGAVKWSAAAGALADRNHLEGRGSHAPPKSRPSSQRLMDAKP